METVENQQKSGRRIFRSASFLLFILVPLLSLVAIQPILTGILPWRGDGLLHLVRLAELERAVRAGVVFPRWSPDLGYGYGFPLFHYYAPFSYYVGLIPRLLGLSLPVSMAVSYVLALWVLGWGTALWARDVWRDWLGVITAVLAILYAPYILYNTYHRAALAELWGLAWLVLVLWAVNKAISDCRLTIDDSWRSSFKSHISNLVLIAVFYALLILSHNITAMIGTALIIGYALFLLVSQRSFILHPSSFILFGLLLGLGLSAFFWLPAFFERNLVQIENLTATSSFTYVNHFLAWIDMLAWPKTADPLQVNPAIPRSLSWLVVGLAILAWLPIKRFKIERLKTVKAQRLGLAIATLLCLFMVLPWSQPLWEAIGLLSFVQFPWRFLGPASIFLAMLAGFGAMQVWSLVVRRWSKRNVLRIAYCVFITSSIILFALPWLFPSRAQSLPDDISPAATIQFEVETGWLGTTAAADYLPRTVQVLPVPDVTRSGLAATQLPAGLVVTDWEMAFTSLRFNYESDKTTTVTEPVEVIFHQFLFPGWQATLDGNPLSLAPSDAEGLITAVLPPGEHTFELTFGNTPLRTVANLISVISFITLFGLIIYAVSHKSESRSTSQFTSNPQSPIISQFIIYSVATVLVIFGLKTLLLDHINTPFRNVQFNEQTLASNPSVNFGNVVKLMDADWLEEPIPADRDINITLVWQAQPPVAEEYSVSVQLLGMHDRRVAQSDSFHPAGLPLPRWQTGEYGFDTHKLSVLPATPPGEYKLVIFVYNLETGQRLDVLNEAGQPIGNEFSPGGVYLIEPTQYANPSDLAISKMKMEDGSKSPFLAENVQLLGFEAPLETVEVGQVVPLTLYWHTPQTPQFDYNTNIWIECENGITAVPILPSTASFSPNTSWQPGQIQRAEFDVPLRPVDNAGNPLQAGFCTLYLRLSANEEVNNIALETFEIAVPERNYLLPETATSTGSGQVVPLNQSLANLITLAGFTLDQSSETLSLMLYWKSEALIDTSYKIFVQLLDENGRLLSQQDHIPANGTRPTTGWVPGEIITDDYTLVIPPDAAPGNYQLITGLYNAETGQRLPLSDGSGDAITLPVSIEVKTAE